MTDYDRTSPEYVKAVLDEFFEGGGDVPVGLCIPQPPESYRELQTAVEAARNTECEFSNVIDGIMELLGLLPDRDEAVRQLAFDTTAPAIMFVLPDMKKIAERLKEKE